MIRSVEDMVQERNAPEAPAGVAGGRSLVEIEGAFCLFPVRREPGTTFFCASAVAPENWGGGQHSRYCAFHRDYLAHCESVAEEKAA
ncbi:hypothetical protein JYP46_01655 [Nitratireductor aquimarinus]|uniref:hypothetical protein n=1 Tax=Alphaproteobacteria TaxID=28211 RepID=UPI0019D39C37|nr:MULTISPECIES: hypothetical protein [Alphaproteobacteria]MBN7755516.1 hypothetical protein [Nitratireductor aquimarinus]MBY5998271.1 hypothetical protein [Tritonibacter mobilis]MBY6020300.1 hypothetical protein [Nitratireductor sp. DP7N14-4]